MTLIIPIDGAANINPTPVMYEAVMSGDIYSGYNARAESTQSATITNGITNAYFRSSGDIANVELYQKVGAAVIGAVNSYDANNSLDVVAGDSFLILADLINAELNTALTGDIIEMRARLEVNGVELDISDFQYLEPEDKLGATLNVTLSYPDPELVPAGADILFAIDVVTPLGTVPYVILENGKLAGRSYQIGYQRSQSSGPADTVTFGALDLLADRFTLAPRRPVVMFNPDRVKYEDVKTKTRDAVLDDKGKPILPVLEPVYGLTMKRILQRAYTGIGGLGLVSALSNAHLLSMSKVADIIASAATEQLGIGFSQVITNIPDFEVDRADGSIEGSWHDMAQPAVGPLSPIYIPGDNDTLFVLDIENPLPYGYTPLYISGYEYSRAAFELPFRPDINAVTVTYQLKGHDAENLLERTVVKQYEPEKNGGTYGEAGYTEVLTTEHVVEKYYAEDPDDVIDSYVTQYNSETRVDPGTGIGPLLVSKEMQQDFYNDDLKVGHYREVEGLVLMGSDASRVPVKIMQENNEIEWIDNPFNPGEKIQARSYTRTQKLVYYTGETVERIDANGDIYQYEVVYPIDVAQASNLIVADEGNTSFVPAEIRVEKLRVKPGNQLDVVVTVIDLLNDGAVKQSYASPVVGNPSSSSYDTRQRTRLLRDLASEALIGPRVPQNVNAGELPERRAIELGWRILNRLNAPLYRKTIDLPIADFRVRKGGVTTAELRGVDGGPIVTGEHIVLARGINGSNLGTKGHTIDMSIVAVELPG